MVEFDVCRRDGSWTVGQSVKLSIGACVTPWRRLDEFQVEKDETVLDRVGAWILPGTETDSKT